MLAESTLSPAQQLRTRRVEAIEEGGAVVLVRHAEDLANLEAARVAFELQTPLQVGEQLLIAGNAEGEKFAIGRLSRPQPVERIELASGAKAVVSQNGPTAVLQVFSSSGQLLFELDDVAQQTRVHLGAADCHFVTEGSLAFTAKGPIAMASEEAVQIAGESGVEMRGGKAIEASSLVLRKHRGTLRGDQLQVAATHLDVRSGHLRAVARTVQTRMEQLRVVVDSLESIAGTVLQKAQQMFCKVSESRECHVGDDRTLVAGTAHLQANRIRVKSDTDVKIDGDQIHLG